jgi:biopolymer transport protein ExbB
MQAIADTADTVMKATPPPPPLPPATPMEQPGFIENFIAGFVLKFKQGGPMMWVLLFFSIFGLAVIVAKFISLAAAKQNARKFMTKIVNELNSNNVEGAIAHCQRTRGPVASIVAAGLDKYSRGADAVLVEKAIERAGVIELSILERGLVWISTVANVAPVVGFLGTVTGMINAFNAIAAAGEIDPSVVASGISEALITTASGLIIAFPTQTMHNYFATQIDRFIVDMEDSAAKLMDAIEILESGKSGN